jgi:YHS domain-containing protein
LAKDLICGMDVDEKTAEDRGLVTEYKGKKYYFCAPGCKFRFEKDPEKYISE